MNYRAISLSIIVCCSLIKVFSFYWLFVGFSCIVVAVLGILSVILSSSTEQSLTAILRNPLEQQTKIKIGLNCKLLRECEEKLHLVEAKINVDPVILIVMVQKVAYKFIVGYQFTRQSNQYFNYSNVLKPLL